MTIYDLKTKFQDLLRPLVNTLANLGVTANQVTVGAFLLSAIWGFCILGFPTYGWPFYLLPVVLLVRMALNAIDGMLAKEHDQKTPLGAILNELGDVLSDTVLYLPFAIIPGIDECLVVFVVILAIISEMTGVISVQIGASRRYDGPMGKSDRAFAFGFMGVLWGFGIAEAFYINLILLLIIFTLLLTICNRACGGLKELSDAK